MKIIFTSIFTFLICWQVVGQSCLPDGITFNSQEEIDNFSTNYPDCKVIEGNVDFDDNVDFTSLTGLSQIKEIKGDLTLRARQFTNLNGLENLESIGGSFTLVRCHLLTNLEALSNLKSVGNNLRIQYNLRLLNLKGLENLESVGETLYLEFEGNSFEDFKNLKDVGALTIYQNDNIMDLQGLEGIRDSLKGLIIYNNRNLVSLSGLSDNLILTGVFEIRRNFELTDISAIEEWDITPEQAEITYNSKLSNCSIKSICQSIYACFYNIGNNGIDCNSLQGLSAFCTGNGNAPTNPTCFPNGLKFDPNNIDLTLFHLIFPNCDEIYGNVEIEMPRNLLGLQNIKKIHGDLEISWGDRLTNFEGLHNLEVIDGDLILRWFENIKNFEGLTSLKRINGRIDLNWADSLKNFEGLKNIEYIGGNIDISWANINSFKGLETLKRIDGDFAVAAADIIPDCQGLNSLVQMNGTIGSRFPALSFNGFDNLRYVGSVVVDSPEKKFSDLPKIDSIENLTIREVEDLSGLENLEYCPSFYISYSPDLEDLSPIRNIRKIESLTINGTSISDCHFDNICRALGDDLNGNDVAIYNNTGNCETEEDVFFSCDIGGKINFNTFFDINKNGIQDQGELFIGNIPIRINPTNRLILASSISDSKIYPEFGTYDISIELNNESNWKTGFGQNNFNVELSSSKNQETINIPLTPNMSVYELVSSIAPTRFRCGEETLFEVRVRNLGTEFGTGTVWLDIDEKLSDFRSEPAIDTISTDWANSIGWHFKDLYPGHEIIFKVYIQTPLPPAIVPGEVLKFKSFFNPIIENGRPVTPDFVFEHQEEFRCSYDPNDKLVSPNRQFQTFDPPQLVDYTLFDENIIYTIRFQNTGNDVAYDVTIRDTLDTNIEPSSFTLLASSHYEVLNTSIEEERFLTFDFKEIYLPDSSANLDKSQGFVSYIVKAKDGLNENTPIKNTASIYFDFNPPIVTNTTENVMVSMLPTSSTQTIDNQLNITLSPNPTKGKIFFKGDNLQKAKITITDLTGRIILVEKLNGSNEIDLPANTKGMLFVKIETEEGVAVKRVLKS